MSLFFRLTFALFDFLSFVRHPRTKSINEITVLERKAFEMSNSLCKTNRVVSHLRFRFHYNEDLLSVRHNISGGGPTELITIGIVMYNRH